MLRICFAGNRIVVRELRVNRPFSTEINEKGKKIPLNEEDRVRSEKKKEEVLPPKPRPEWKTKYFPIKMVKFDEANKFHKIYQLDRTKSLKKSLLSQFLWCFPWFTSYLTAFIFYFDFSNKLHYLALTLLFLKGIPVFLRKQGAMASEAKQMFMLSEDTFVVVLPANYFCSINSQRNTVLKGHPVVPETNSSDVVIKFKLNDITEAGFLEELAFNETTSKTWVDKLEEAALEKGIKMTSQNTKKKEEPEKINPLSLRLDQTLFLEIKPEEFKEPISVHCKIGANTEKQYDDYLVAIGEHKRIVVKTGNE